MELLEWHNLIFALPLAWPVLYLVMMLLGLSGGEGDAEHDVDLDHDLDVNGDVDADADAGAEVDGGTGILDRVLGALGVGKAPLSILLISFCFLWAGAGLVGNWFWSIQSASAWPAMWKSLAVAAGVSLLGTRFIARAIHRLIPSVESYGSARRDLLGMTAEVLHDVSHEAGTARLRDDFGNLLDVSVRVGKNDRGIPTGSKVVLMRHDPKGDVFFVSRT